MSRIPSSGSHRRGCHKWIQKEIVINSMAGSFVAGSCIIKGSKKQEK